MVADEAAGVHVKYTYVGDFDLSGIVDADDYSRIDIGAANHLTGLTNGVWTRTASSMQMTSSRWIPHLLRRPLRSPLKARYQ
jgi:hypothetical protein